MFQQNARSLPRSPSGLRLAASRNIRTTPAIFSSRRLIVSPGMNSVHTTGPRHAPCNRRDRVAIPSGADRIPDRVLAAPGLQGARLTVDETSEAGERDPA